MVVIATNCTYSSGEGEREGGGGRGRSEREREGKTYDITSPVTLQLERFNECIAIAELRNC